MTNQKENPSPTWLKVIVTASVTAAIISTIGDIIQTAYFEGPQQKELLEYRQALDSAELVHETSISEFTVHKTNLSRDEAQSAPLSLAGGATPLTITNSDGASGNIRIPIYPNAQPTDITATFVPRYATSATIVSFITVRNEGRVPANDLVITVVVDQGAEIMDASVVPPFHYLTPEVIGQEVVVRSDEPVAPGPGPTMKIQVKTSGRFRVGYDMELRQAGITDTLQLDGGFNVQVGNFTLENNMPNVQTISKVVATCTSCPEPLESSQ